MRAVSSIIFLLAAGTVQAQSYTVTSNADTNTAGTLRYAIGQANSYGAGATINFNSGLGTIQLTSALPTLPSNLTINGNGNTITGASGSDAYYVITNNGPIFYGATPGLTTLTVASGNLTVSAGTTINGGNGGNDYNGVGPLVSENLSGGTAVAFGSGGILSIGGSIAGGTGGIASPNSGGDGGTGVVASSANASVQITGTGIVAGGNGGQGHSSGGNGGAGVQFNAFGSVTNSGTVSGGNGAQGTGIPGNGGAGVNFIAGGSLNNSGTITGGNGNTATTMYAGGSGGNAVSFSGGGTVMNSGTITGGAGGGASDQQPAGAAGAAIAITGGVGTFTNMNHGVINGNVILDNYANSVTLQIGSTINGSLAVGTSSSATLTLTDDGSGGSQNYSAAVSGTTTFNGQLIKNGSSTWVIDQSMSYAGGTTINAGTLSISTDANLGASTGGLTLNGGTLQITGTSFTSTARSINWGASGGGFDINAAGNTFTLTQTIANGGTLTKYGAGTLVIGGTADNVGLGITVNAGTVVLGKTSASGVHAVGGGGLTINSGGTAQLGGTGGDQIYDNATVTLNGGTLDLNARTETIGTLNGTATSTVTNTNSAAIGTLTVTGGGAYSGTLGTAGIGIGLTVAGSGQTLTISGTTDNGYLAVTVNAGTLVLAKSSSPSVHALGNGLTVNAGATVQLAGSGGDQIYDGTGVTLNGGTLVMNGRNETIASLDGTSGGTLTNKAGTGNPSTLTINGSGSYAGTIADGSSGGTVAIVKSASGTLTLSGANTYSGGTIVSGGTLIVSSTTGSGAVTVSNATLGGTGSIAGPITLNSGGILAPGSGNSGTLTTAGITFNSGSTLAIKITSATAASPGSGGSTAGNLPNLSSNTFLNNLNGTVSGLNLLSLSVDGTGTAFAVNTSYSYIIASGMGNQSALDVTNPASFTIFDLPANDFAVNASLTGNTLGNVYLNFTVLPEPGLLLILGAAMLGMTRRRLR